MWDKSAVSEKIELIKSAIENNEKISFTYYSPNGISIREIEPYHLVFQWSSWYVWGFCTERNDYRMFKLTRLTNLKCTYKKMQKQAKNIIIELQILCHIFSVLMMVQGWRL